MTIQEKIQYHYDYICKHYNKDQILGVFLYGSQNYGIDLPTSDVDTKAIYIPTLSELAFEQPLSKEFILPNDEHCEIKDIREMVKNFKKQNVNFIEILFTKYFILNPKYEEIWKKYFIAYKNDIARYDIHVAVKSMSHQASHTLNQDPFDGKKVSNALRLLYFLEGYIRGDDYESCIIATEDKQSLLLDLKSGYYATMVPLSKVIQIGLNGYKDKDLSHLVDKEKRARLDLQMRKGCLELIKLNF